MSMPSASAVAADIVLIAHALFALFAVVGAFLVLLYPMVGWLHIPTVIWSSVVNLANWRCPLTPLEQSLRARAGQPAFDGSWTQHYVEPLVRPLGMPRRMELIAGFSILGWNLLLYAVGLIWCCLDFGPE